MSKVISLTVGNICISLGEPDLKTEGAFIGGDIISSLHTEEDGDINNTVFNKQIDVIESVVLAHAIAGIDVRSPAYLEGLETTLDAIGNH